ncbi:MAG: OmpA family protein [Planctomycetes bacterium]|nr:OmpA family protein [Planctomycetota bacterium]
MAGHGGGAWKVAYADFVTAMMAFFLVMWIVAQGKPVKEAIAQYFQDPFGASKEGSGGGGGRGKSEEGSTLIGPLKSGQGPGRGATKGYIRSSRKQDKEAAATKPGLFVMHDASDSRTGTVVLFGEDSAELDGDAEHQLNDLIQVLVGKANKIEIRGHASRRPLPPENPLSNPWQLCYARCVAAMKYLVDHGIEPQRIRLSQSGVYEQTVRSGPDWSKENSRVEIFALNEFVDALPGTREERAEPSTKASPPPHAEPPTSDHPGDEAHSPAADGHH